MFETTTISSSDKTDRNTLDRALDAFYDGWENGNWDRFIGMLSDDLTFQFPIAPFRGRHKGKSAKQKVLGWARSHLNDNIRINNENLRIYDGPWVSVCIHTAGIMKNKPFDGLLAFFMKASNGQITEIREYCGDISIIT